MRQPRQPSEEEKEEHEHTHLKFEPWCLHCVAGQAKDEPHRSTAKPTPVEDEAKDVIQVDYMFLVSKRNQVVTKKRTVLCAVDEYGEGIASEVHSKGNADEYAAKQLEAFLKETGLLGGAILQHDPECACGVVCTKVASSLKGVEIRQTPRKSHASNGRVEQFHQKVQGQVRTWKSFLEQKLGITIDPDHVVVPWLIRHSAWGITRFQAFKKDGLTPRERRTGVPYTSKILKFGEQVQGMTPGEHREKMEIRWHTGVWLGRSSLSDEHIIGLAEGVRLVRTVRRMSPENQWSAKAIQELIGVPWDLKGEAETKNRAEAVKSGTDVKPGERVKMTATPGCKGCSDSHRYHHTKACQDRRKRFYVGDPDSPPETLVEADKAPKRAKPNEEAGSSSTTTRKDDSAAQDSEMNLDEPQARSPPKGDVQMGDDANENAMDTKESRSNEEEGQNEPKPKKSKKEEQNELILMIEYLMEDVLNIEQVHMDIFPKDLQMKGRTKELDRLKKFKVFLRKLRSELPEGRKPFGVRWAEKFKGEEVRSRLCVKDIAKEISQEFFAATPSPASLRLLLLIAVVMGLDVQTADLDTAFMHAPLQDPEYCEACDEDQLDETHEFYGMDYIWELWQAMNGLRKAPQAYQQWFTKTVREAGFVPLIVDSQVFVHRKLGVYMDVHVDDPLMVGTPENMKIAWDMLKKKMSLRINEIVKEGETIVHLGYKYTKLRNGFKTKIQDGYVEDTLILAGMENCKGIRNPCCGPITKEDAELMMVPANSPEEHELYRKIIGRIQFLCGNRDDILYATKECAKDLAAPTQWSWKKLKRLLRYLQYTKHLEHVLTADGLPDKITTFIDADWAKDPETRRSTSAGCVLYGGARLCSWSRTQKTVALSSGEAEFTAMAAGVSEGQFIRNLLEEIFEKEFDHEVHTDSTAARGMAMRKGAGRVRHLDTKLCFVQDYVENRRVKILKVDTKLNVADLNTKGHPPARHWELLRMLNCHLPEHEEEVLMIDESDDEADFGGGDEIEGEINTVDWDTALVQAGEKFGVVQMVNGLTRGYVTIETRYDPDGARTVCVVSMLLFLANLIFFMIEVVDKMLKLREWCGWNKKPETIQQITNTPESMVAPVGIVTTNLEAPGVLELYLENDALAKVTMKELQEVCRRNNLPTTFVKQDLVNRIMDKRYGCRWTVPERIEMQSIEIQTDVSETASYTTPPAAPPAWSPTTPSQPSGYIETTAAQNII